MGTFVDVTGTFLAGMSFFAILSLAIVTIALLLKR
jgi:hypothetical protein